MTQKEIKETRDIKHEMRKLHNQTYDTQQTLRSLIYRLYILIDTTTADKKESI